MRAVAFAHSLTPDHDEMQAPASIALHMQPPGRAGTHMLHTYPPPPRPHAVAPPLYMHAYCLFRHSRTC